MHSTEQLNTALDGRYVIERRIGEGGMAVVYLARDLKHGRHVAMKVVHPELAALIGAERFLSEIHVTANLQHPHILPLFDSGEVRDPDGFTVLYYVMPYVEGESLRARLDRDQQLAIDDAIRITRDVAAALDYAHRQGVVHRDIKPENILLHDGSALVADFGIALAVSNAGRERLTQTGLSLGTPQYMSPEQASGVKRLDGRTDVYSLGCVLYEMLMGEPPFTGHNAQAVVARVLTETPRPIRGARSTVPDWLDAITLTAIAKLPADRFGSAAEFAEALNSGGMRLTRATAANSSTMPARGRIRAWQAATTAAIAVAAIVIYFALQRPSEDSHELQLARQLTFDGNVVGAEISPDGLWLAYVTDDCLGRDFSCGNSLQMREVDGTQSVRVAKWPRIETDIKWSPDGSTIVFRGSPDTTAVALYLAPRLGGSLRAVPISPNAFSFTADGRSILCAVGNISHSTLVRFDVSTLSPIDSVPLPRGFNYLDVSVSPDGSLIAAAVRHRGTISQVLLIDGAGRLVDSAAVSVRPRIRWSGAGDGLYVLENGPGTADDLNFVPVSHNRIRAKERRVALGQVQQAYAGIFSVARGGRVAILSTPMNFDLLGLRLDEPQRGWHSIVTGSSFIEAWSITPAGDIAATATDNLGDNIYLFPFEGGPRRPITAERNTLEYPSESPNGRHLVYARVRGGPLSHLVLADEKGGRTRVLMEGISTGEWLDDSTIVIFRDNGFSLIDTLGRQRSSVAIPDSLRYILAYLLGGPNSRRLGASSARMAFWSTTAEALVVTDLRSRKTSIVSRSVRPIAPVGWLDDGSLIAQMRGDSSAVTPEQRRNALVRFADGRAPFVRIATMPGCYVAIAGHGRAACVVLETHPNIWLADRAGRSGW